MGKKKNQQTIEEAPEVEAQEPTTESSVTEVEETNPSPIEDEASVAEAPVVAAKKRRNPLRIFGPKQIAQNIRQKRPFPLLVYSVLLAVLVVAAVPATRYKALALAISRPYDIHLVDSETKKPVTEAIITIDGTQVKTDNKGVAHFEKLRVGKKSATIEKPNYEKTTESLFVGLSAPKQPVEYAFKATGRQVGVLLKDYISQQPLSNVYVSFDSFEARSDDNGVVQLIIPTGKESVEVTLQKDSYNAAKVTATVDESTEPTDKNTFTLTPSGKIYMLSKQSGKIDVVKTNLDGSERQVVLAGTGYEQDYNTVLIASRDWKHVAVASVRNKEGKEAIQYIRTSDDKITVADEGDATFTLTGWYGDKLVYIVNRNVENEAEKYKLKSYNTETGKITLLDKTNYKDNGYNCDKYCGQDITNDTITAATLIDGGVVYVYQSTGKSLSISKVYRIQVSGEGKKELFAISDRYISNLIGWNPEEVYFNYYDFQSQKEQYYEASFKADLAQQVTDPVEIATVSNGTYNAYLLSPDSKKTFWTESRDGKNVFFTGGKTGDDPKELFREAEYAAYGWFTDNYLLVTKNQSEMYILSAEGGVPVKVSDYHKPANGYRPYGYGYGG